MRTTMTTLALMFAACTLPAYAEVQTFKIDNTHSFANWSLRHIVAITSGTFHDVQGNISLNTADIAKSNVEATISVYSLNSSHIKRDVHVLTDEYLDARNYPDMKFVSTRVVPATPEKGKLTGNLTLHGVVKPVTLDYEILGLGKDPWGGSRIGLKATTQLKRSDFGINKHVPNGPVGNEVDITLLIEGIRIGADGQPWSAVQTTPKAISFPAPVEVAPAPVALPTSPVQPAVTPAPAPAPAEQPKESAKDQLKKQLLKGLFN